MKKAKRGNGKAKQLPMTLRYRVEKKGGDWTATKVGAAESAKFDLDHGSASRLFDMLAIWCVRECAVVPTDAIRRLADRAQALLREVSDSAYELGQLDAREGAGKSGPLDKRGRRIGRRARGKRKSPAAVAA
jgi:hypothetical protein